MSCSPQADVRYWFLFLIFYFSALGVTAVQAQETQVQAADLSVDTVVPYSEMGFEGLVSKLPVVDYSEKKEIIARLVQLNAPQTKKLLAAFLEGQLYSRSSDNRVFIAAELSEGFQLTDAISLNNESVASVDGLENIGTNNSLRKTLRAAIAQFDLSSASAEVRSAAVTEMLRSLDDSSAAALREQLSRETDVKIKEAIQVGLALVDLDSADVKTRLAALGMMNGSTNTDVYNRLKQLITPNEDGSYTESDLEVRTAARKLVNQMDKLRALYGAGETVFFGISLGSVLVLSAIGLAITFGVMGVINMAHGELMMLGAYTTYVVQLLMPNHISASIFVAIPAAFIVSGLVGVLIERGLVRFLYGRPLETLLATFGVSLILQQLVRDLFTANNRPVETPSWMAGSWQVNEIFSLTFNRLYVVLFTVLAFAALLVVLKRTTLGLNVRAVAQNRSMARAMGIRTAWVDAITFGLGSGIAGVAGVALSQLTNVGPNLGQQYIVDSFMVVVFGGVGNLWGTLISGMSLGVVNKLLEPYAGAVLAKIFVLIFLILFIQRRPRGLFPQKGRAAEG